MNKFLIAVFVLFAGFSTLIAQQKEMTEEQWMVEMALQKAKADSVKMLNNALEAEVKGLQAASDKVQKYDDCVDDLYKSLGVSRSDVDNFRKMVSDLEGKIRRSNGTDKAALQAELDALKKNKISALPEFFDKVHRQLQEMLDQVKVMTVKEESQDWMYTVVKGDCLWYIAKKKDYYGNGFAWPKIYKANKDQIKNPDLIYPKQSFKIPRLTDDEKAQYEKMRKNYKPAPVK